MAEAKAILSDYRQSPRKVRIVADMVRGKKVADAIITLSFIPKRSALPLQKLLASALANAKNLSLPTENLIVKEIRVDGGKILYRSQPRSHGQANPIRKRTTHVQITLAEGAPKKLKKARANRLAKVSPSTKS